MYDHHTRFRALLPLNNLTSEVEKKKKLTLYLCDLMRWLGLLLLGEMSDVRWQ